MILTIKDNFNGGVIYQMNYNYSTGYLCYKQPIISVDCYDKWTNNTVMLIPYSSCYTNSTIEEDNDWPVRTLGVNTSFFHSN